MYPPGPEIQRIEVRETPDKSGIELVNERWPLRVAINPILVVHSTWIQPYERSMDNITIHCANAEALYRRVGSDGNHYPVYDLISASVGGVAQEVNYEPPGKVSWADMVVEQVGGGLPPDDADGDDRALEIAGMIAEQRAKPAEPVAPKPPAPAQRFWWSPLLDYVARIARKIGLTPK